MKLHRDVYEGTDFDMTKGLIAGPVRQPEPVARVGPARRGLHGPGAHDLASRSAPTASSCSRAGGCRRGLAASRGSPRTTRRRPASCRSMPGTRRCREAFEIGSRAEFDRRSAWWAFNFAGNWANLNYNAMARRDPEGGDGDRGSLLRPAADRREDGGWSCTSRTRTPARAYISDYSNRSAQDVVDAWWKLADTLVVRYQDLGQNLPGAAGAARRRTRRTGSRRSVSARRRFSSRPRSSP